MENALFQLKILAERLAKIPPSSGSPAGLLLVVTIVQTNSRDAAQCPIRPVTEESRYPLPTTIEVKDILVKD